jgi:hypothetical protein
VGKDVLILRLGGRLLAQPTGPYMQWSKRGIHRCRFEFPPQNHKLYYVSTVEKQERPYHDEL